MTGNIYRRKIRKEWDNVNHENEIRKMLNVPNILSCGPTFSEEIFFSYTIESCGMYIYVYFDRVEILYASYQYTFSHAEFLKADTSNLVGWLANLKENTINGMIDVWNV